MPRRKFWSFHRPFSSFTLSLWASEIVTHPVEVMVITAGTRQYS
jgi:hypothetical protein